MTGSVTAAILSTTAWSGTLLLIQTVTLAILIYVASKVWTLWSYSRKNGRVFADYHGPKENHWLYGNLKHFPKDCEEEANYVIKLCEKYSKNGYIRLWIGFNRPLVVIHAPQTMRKILKTAEPKATGLAGGYRLMMPWIGDGLLVSSGAKWTRNRRLLTPGFHFDVLKPYIGVYNRATDVLMNNINHHADMGENFEVFQYICNCALDIILKCAFSFDKEVQNMGSKDPYVTAVTELSLAVDYRRRRPWMLLDFVYNLSPAGRAFKNNVDFVHRFSEELIEKRREALERGEEDLRKQKYLDFLDILLTARDEDGQGLSPLDVRNEVDTFLFGGHDTTASGISWILYSLAGHPDIQRKAQAEVDSLLDGRDSEDIEWSDLQSLEYLTMCIKVGLRLHGTVPQGARQLTQNLDLGDRVVPKGTMVQINIWALHHNRDVWGETHWEYDPDRFSKDKVTKMDHYQFVPFSAGPRNCIGQHFAMNEMRVVIAKLLRNFTFKLDKTRACKHRIAFVMRSDTGLYMYATKRRH